ncbi:MAG TPA: hypothetical protein VEV19_16565 [Ktedonobacteraceae bacterium]|nr:hypothetical protein [Ktedonobacteraceae bacterium]
MNFSLSAQNSDNGSSPPPKAPFTVKSGPTGAMPGMLAGQHGVPLAMPLPFLLTGAIASAIFGILLPWIVPEAMLAPGFPHLLALVHIATLGWLTMTIMGASLQLIPVIIVAPLRATRFLYGQYPLYLAGVILLILGFWWMYPLLMAIGGTLIVLAVLHYVIVLAITLAHGTKYPLTVRFLVTSLVYLCIVVSLGLTAALDFQVDFLGTFFSQLLLTHITIGVLGWLSTTLIGVSYTLVRLFALAHEHNDRLGKIVFILLNASIIGLSTGFIFSWTGLILLAGGMLTISIWLFAYDYWRMLRVRHRKVLDVTQYHSTLAVLTMSIVIPVGVATILFGWWQPAMLAALALLTLVGWLGQSIIGYLYKIVLFLLWNKRYGPLVGRQKVPLMRDMIHQRWAAISLWCINVGLLGAVCSALLGLILPLQIASAVLGAGLVLSAINIVGVVFA